MLTEKKCAGACGRGCRKILPINNFIKKSETEWSDICISCKKIANERAQKGKLKKRIERLKINHRIAPLVIIETEADKKRNAYREARKNEWAQLRKFSSENYERIFNEQNGLCKICFKDTFPKRLVFDHEHGTNPIKIRGLICGHCNTALGFVKDNTETLKNMIDYLNNQKKQ